MSDKSRIDHHSSFGGLWVIGWLFTIGFLKPSFWQGALALLVWPYFLGAHFAASDTPAAEAAAPPPAEIQQD
ncbi:MAG: hypothetical protein Tsb0010_19710 [Parvularculaceae bacterium]